MKFLSLNWKFVRRAFSPRLNSLLHLVFKLISLIFFNLWGVLFSSHFPKNRSIEIKGIHQTITLLIESRRRLLFDTPQLRSGVDSKTLLPDFFLWESGICFSFCIFWSFRFVSLQNRNSTNPWREVELRNTHSLAPYPLIRGPFHGKGFWILTTFLHFFVQKSQFLDSQHHFRLRSRPSVSQFGYPLSST